MTSFEVDVKQRVSDRISVGITMMKGCKTGWS